MRLSAIWRYPVKSCGGVSLRAADVDHYGVVDDRVFAITQPGGKLLTQRTVPKLNLISAELSEQTLRLRASGMPDLAIDRHRGGAPAQVTLSDVIAPAVFMGQEASQWLSEFLDRPCTLVQSRELFARRMPSVAAHLFLEEQMRYPDCAPLLLMSQSSLDDLNGRLAGPVEMSRFRPNLVIEGLAPYQEDSLSEIRIGSLVLDYMGRCERCGITLIAPGTDRRGVEPLLTLRSYRFHPDRLESGLMFGVYFKPRFPARIRCGDEVEILNTSNRAQPREQGIHG